MLPSGATLLDYLPNAQVAARKAHIRPTAVFDYDDCLGAAYLALCEAELTYDPSRGAFSTYVDMRLGFDIMSAYRRQFRSQTYRDKYVWHRGESAVSSDAHETIGDNVLAETNFEYLDDLFDGLTQLERTAIVAKYWHDLDGKVIAQARGVGETVISRARKTALKKLRGMLEETGWAI